MFAQLLMLVILGQSPALELAGLPGPVPAAYVDTTGGLVYFLAQTTSNGQPAGITAVPANPTIQKNGAAVTVLGPYWGSASHVEPWVCYQLTAPALPTDSFTFSAPAGWLASGSNTIGAASGLPIQNFTSVAVRPKTLEPAPIGWGLSNFGVNTGTCKLGMDVNGPTSASGYTYHPARNWLRRAYVATGTTVDGTGHPLTITASNGSASYNVIDYTWNASTGNAGIPAHTGTYTFMADDSGSPPMVVSLAGNKGISITPVSVPPSGLTTGRTWTWQVQIAAPRPANTDPGLTLVVATPNGKPGPWTLSNEWFSPPYVMGSGPLSNVVVTAGGSGYTNPSVFLTGSTIGSSGPPTTTITLSGGAITGITVSSTAVWVSPPTVTITDPTGTGASAAAVLAGSAATIDRTDPVAPDQNVISWLTTPSGKGPCWVRWNDQTSGFDGESNTIDVADLRDPNQFSWFNSPPAKTFTITQFGPYTPKNLYVSDAWPGAVASNPGDPLPYVFNTGGSYNYLLGVGFGQKTGLSFFCCEATTAQPHGLKTGQSASWSSSTPIVVPIANSAGSGTFNLASLGINVFVTGSNTFTFVIYGGLPGGTLGNLTATVPCNAAGQVSAPNGLTAPYELAANYSKYLNTGIYINIPTVATLATVREIATRVMNNSSPTCKIAVEYGNEHWDKGSPRNRTLWGLGSFDSTLAPNDIDDQAYIKRASAVWQAFEGVFSTAGRTNPIIRVAGSFWEWGQITQNMIAYANANGIRIDAIVVAPYPDCPKDPSFVQAAASLASTDPRSAAYGKPNPWTRPMWCSIYRHHLKYNTHDIGQWAAHRAAIATYTGPPTAYGQFPALGCYENAAEIYVPEGVDISNKLVNGTSLRMQLAADLRYDPSSYWVESALYESAQDGGAVFVNRYNLCWLGTSDGTWDGGRIIGYGAYTHAAQRPGYGDGTDGHTPNRFSLPGGAVDWSPYNDSVWGQCWRDWANIAN